MGYPTAYRTQAARLSRGPKTVVVITPRQKTPPPSKATRAATMQRITEVAEMPPLGYSDIWRLLRAARMMSRLHPLGKAFDIAEVLWDLNTKFGNTTVHPAGSGWVVCCITPIPVSDNDMGYRGGGGSPSNCGPISLCGQGGGSSTFQPWGDLPWTFRISRHRATGFVTAREHYRKPSAGFSYPPFASAQADPMYDIFSPYRQLDPHHWSPILRPVPNPIPINPLQRPEPQPGDRSERGYSPPAAAEQRFAKTSPVTWPPTAPPLGRAPPPAGTKEKKFRMTKVAGGVEKALKSGAFVDGKLKDLRDFIKAMDESLPKELQAKGKCKKQLPCVMMNLWMNLDKMDASEAFLNILKEIGEDLLGGAGDRLRSAAATKNGWFKNKIFTSPRF